MKHAFAEYVRNKEAPISLSHSVRVSVSRSVHVFVVYNVHYMQCMFEQLHQMPVRLYLMVEKEAIQIYCLFGSELMQLIAVQCAPN